MHHVHARTEPAASLVSANPHAQVPELAGAELARRYDNNSAPRNAADLATLRALSAEAFAAGLPHRSHRIGAAEYQTVDVFLPTGAVMPVPALVFVHGGRWRMNTSRETAFWARACVDAGIAFVGINFPKLGAVRLGDVVASVRHGVGSALDRAAEWGIDAGAVALAGHSSGAHLALTAALVDPLAHAAPRPADWLPRIRALYLLGGMYDLRPLLRTAAPAQLGFDAAEAEAMSPLLQLARLASAADAGRAPVVPPVLVGVGAQESSEFVRQALALHWALGRMVDTEWQAIEDAAHFDAALEFNRAQSMARAFLLRHLAPGR